MNNFSPLPASASDSRLSRPEAMAPDPVDPALQARRQKLRRIVAWVVGGATLLMCVGLVLAGIRAHSEPAASDDAVGPTVRLVAPPAAVAAPQPDPASIAVVTPAVPAVSAAAGPTKPSKKLAVTSHVGKWKRATTKAVVLRH